MRKLSLTAYIITQSNAKITKQLVVSASYNAELFKTVISLRHKLECGKASTLNIIP